MTFRFPVTSLAAAGMTAAAILAASAATPGQTAPALQAPPPRVISSLPPRPQPTPTSLPLSRVLESPRDGVTLYSSDVNRFHGVAENTDGTWLATDLGIKRVAAKGGAIRQYTRRDGLAGNVVLSVAATDAGVWCVTRGGEETDFRLAVCFLPHGADRWQQQLDVEPSPARLSRESDSYNGGSSYSESGRGPDGEGLFGAGARVIALGNGGVAFTPGRLEPEETGLLYRWDPSEKTWKDAAPLPAGPNRPEPLVVRFAAAGERRVWLGTNQGLLAWNESERAWERRLEQLDVEAGAAAPAGGGLWVTVRSKKDRAGGYWNGSPPPLVATGDWQLVRVDAGGTEKGRWPQPAASDSAPGIFALRAGPRGGEAPLSLLASPDGATVWVTSLSLFNGGFDPHLNYVSRFDIAGKSWTRMPAAAPAEGNIGDYRPIADDQYVTNDAVPAAALYVLAFSPSRPVRYDWNGGQSNVRYTGGNLQPPFWVRRRFASWLSPDAALPADVAVPAPAGPFVRSVSISDPMESGATWQVISDGASIVRVSAPGKPPEASNPATLSGQELKARLPGYALIPDGRGGVYAQTPVGIYRIEGGSFKASLLPVSAGGSFHSWAPFLTMIVSDGRDGLLAYFRGDYSVLRFDPHSGKTIVLPVVDPPNARLSAAGDGRRLWFWTQTGGVTQAAPYDPSGKAVLEAGESESIQPPPPPGWPAEGQSGPGLAAPSAIVGDVLWYSLSIDAGRATPEMKKLLGGNRYGSVAIGYDSARKRWTEPLPIGRNYSGGQGLQVQSDGAGGAYVTSPGGDDDTGSLYRWDAAKRAWSVVAPAAPRAFVSRQGSGGSRERLLLVSLTKSDVWLLSGSDLVRYEFGPRRWTRVAGPTTPSFGGSLEFSSDNGANFAATRLGDALVIASPNGIFRYDINRLKWDAVPLPAKLGSIGAERGRAGIVTYRFSSLAATRDAVWAVVDTADNRERLIARLDRRTRAWRLWSGADGAPDFSSYNDYRLVSGGTDDSVFCYGMGGVARFDARAGRWRNLPLAPDEAAVAELRRAGQYVPNLTVRSVTMDSGGGGAWIAGYQPRADGKDHPVLWRCDGPTGALTEFDIPNRPEEASAKSDRPDRPVWQRFQGDTPLVERDAVWVSTTRGIYRLRPSTGEWSREPLPAGLPDIRAQRITRADDGALWLAGPSSVLRWQQQPAAASADSSGE